MTQYVACDECDGQRYLVLLGHRCECEICEGEGFLPMPEIPHIQRVTAEEGES
jgi:hypothetical protein